MNSFLTKILILGSSVLLVNACTDYLGDYDDAVEGQIVSASLDKGRMIDNRDGNKYKIVLIGYRYWMAENLRYTDSSKTPNLKGGVWCYESSKDSCSKYGPLYSYQAAMNIGSTRVEDLKKQGICPAGWRMPSQADWNDLISYIGYNVGEDVVGMNVKSIKGWVTDDSLAHKPMNRFGFNAMPAGRRNSENGEFMSTRKYAFFWSSTVKDEGTSYGYTLRYDNDLLDKGFFYKDHGMSVRCVLDVIDAWFTGELDSTYLDEIPFEYDSVKIGKKNYKTIRIGTRNWMAENVAEDVDGSWCYNDKKDNCKKFGRLYSFDQAKEVCPEGWHLPSSNEYSQLMQYIQSARNLRSRDEWTDKGGKGINFWGFNAMPAGGREDGDFFDLRISSYMWTSDKEVFWLRYYDDNFNLLPKDEKTAFSVRCIEDVQSP